ncbi:MAG: MgtC/SapB family protein [candidate division NC10 bacterium]|nr:MgtC/SapB family protein [candidate division NC10 bacterium]
MAILSTAEMDAIIRLLLAILLGGAIGLERESRGRPAGLRTHILVCLGATIIMITSTHMGELTQLLSPTSRIQVDPGRIAAGIVTGIGFLGAGAIIRIGDLVRGLTTAGCIWFVAALGITIGQGLYALAIVSTVLALAVLLALTQVERRIQPVVYRSIAVFAGFAQAEAIERRCQALLADSAIRVQDVHNRLSVAEDRAEITFKISARHHMQSGSILRAIAAIEGVSEARWS